MAAIPNPEVAEPVTKKRGGPSKTYLAELAKLRNARLTPLGRRILTRQALLSHNGQVGAAALAKDLNCEELTVWRVLKADDRCWYERYGKNAENIKLAQKLCKFLRVDWSWLYHTIDYGDLGQVNFDLVRANMWRLK
jgi:hypothetical protein